MSKQFYSVQMSLTDGQSSLSLAYAVSINTAIQMDQQQLENTLFEYIAEEQGFTHNGEYYESVGFCGVNLTRCEPISIQEFNVARKVFKSLVINVS